MIEKFRSKTIERKDWLKLRARVREHILINSKLALEKRMLLSNKRVVVMGGIVVKNPFQKTMSGETPVFVSDGSNMRIYDFSGYFEVIVKSVCLNRDSRRKIYSAKEGDILFIAGEVVGVDEPIGYHLIPISVYLEGEMTFYRAMFPDRFNAFRQKINEVKNSSFTECPSYLLTFSRYPWDVIKLFLNPFLCNMKHDDYPWLTAAIYKIYERTKDVRLAKLILKYYLRETATKDFCLTYEMERKEHFFQYYPDLKGVIEWPEANN